MRVDYVPIEDVELERLLKESEATALTVEQLIRRAVALFLKRGDAKAVLAYPLPTQHSMRK